MRPSLLLAISCLLAGCADSMPEEEVRAAAVDCVAGGGHAQILRMGKYDTSPPYAVKCYGTLSVWTTYPKTVQVKDHRRICEDMGRVYVELDEGGFDCAVKGRANTDAGWATR